MTPIKLIPLHPARADVWSSGAENLAVHLTCDISPFLAVWPDAQPTVAFERADGKKYAHAWSLQGNILHIPLVQADTCIPGVCKCMITLTSGDGQANTAVFCGNVTAGVDTLDEPPAAPEQGVIEQINAAVNDLQARYYVPSVSGGMLTWQPTADDMPSVPASPVGGGSGLLFVRLTADGEGNFSSDLSYAAIEQAVQGGQMAYAVIENTYFLPLIGLAEDAAIFSLIANLFDSMTLLTAIITADGSVVVQGG